MKEKNLLIIISKEEIKINEFSIKSSLKNKGIYVLDKSFGRQGNFNRQDIINQVNLIVNMHKVIAGCRFSGLIRIKSIIGRELEEYKTQIKKLKKHYDMLSSYDLKNDMDKIILCEGKMLLNQGKEALDYIENHGYISIIERSMNREEICIGKCDESNLRDRNGRIEIGTIKSLTYNIIEEDLYKYIKKLQRKNATFELEEIIRQYVYNSHLSANSLKYLNGLFSYPRDCLKIWQKYVENRKDKNEEEFLEEFKNSLKYEEDKIYY